MTRYAFRCLAVALVLVLFSAAAAQPASRQSAPRSRPLLDVPYLPQTEALCGGAATAMVMRYWGERDIYADAFAPYVERSANGIRTVSLVSALQQRGWTAIAGPGDAHRAQEHLGRGRPVIALIQDRPATFHYVVIVGWGRGKVIVHDPARAPFRVLDEAAFDRAWQQSEHWMLVPLPPASMNAAAMDVRAPTTEVGTGPCAGLIDEGIRLSKSGDRQDARLPLEVAAQSCPRSAAAWRELAGLDALDGKWADADAHAQRALAEDPRDEHAWRIVATSRYVRHDDIGALAAWNAVGEPTVDLVDVKGLERTRYGVIADAVDAPPRTLLTPERLRRGEKRVREIPALALARVGFHPLENGRAQVDAAVVERAAAPLQPTAWIGLGLGAAIDREVSTSLASLTGGGELISGSWRWWQHRPRIAFFLAAPAPRALGGGVWRVEALRETETFGSQATNETRSRAGLTLTNWPMSRVRFEGAAGIERFRHLPGKAAALGAAVEYWPVHDRLSLEAQGEAWLGSGDLDRFATTGFSTKWRSSATNVGSVVLASAGVQAASGTAPMLLWPGADTGHARQVLLRAHPLLDDGVIRDGVFGRQLLFGGGEWRRWMRPSRSIVRIAPAAFVDIARATRGLAPSDGRTHIDAGAGMRIAIPGLGVLRLDLAHGLRDGATAFSVGFERR